MLLFFIKKKILFTRHDNMVLFEYVMLLYCILMKEAFNLGHIMQWALLAKMESSKGAKAFLSTIEELCLKYIPSLA